MYTETTQTRETFATQPDPLKLQILAALHRFVRQRPGLDWRNYGDRAAYREEMRGITRDLKEAETLLRQVALVHTITGEDLITASRLSFSGRLSIKVVRRWECACGHKYAAPVELSSTTPNLSGESTAWCPECGARPVHGSPHEIKIDYTTGQYFSTEYRRAVAAICAGALWDWVRDKAMPAPVYRVEWKNERGEWTTANRVYRERDAAEGAAKITQQQLQGHALKAFETPPPRYGETMVVERYPAQGDGYMSAGDWLRRYFRREFGRGIASRWFN